MKFKRILSTLMACAVVLGVSVVPTDKTVLTANAATNSYSFTPEYRQTEARGMLSLVNSFRTGSEAWAWNESNTQKVYYNGLGNMAFDYELERVAMQRAAELVASYSHTRPNGERSFTAYTSTYNNTYKGENIAIGTGSLSAETVFNLWKEANDDYAGQGHRRNILGSNFTSIGIAHAYYNGCHYWVQEFSSKVGSSVKTTAVDTAQRSTVEIDTSTITQSVARCDTKSIALKVGAKVDVPDVTLSIRTSGTWSYAPDLNAETTASWSVVTGSGVVKIQNGQVTGLKAGSASIGTTVNGKQITIPVTVSEDTTVSADLKYQLMDLGDDYYGVRFVLVTDEQAVIDADSASVYISVPDAGDSDVLTVKRAYKNIKAGGQTVSAGDGKVFLMGKFIGIPSDFLDGLTGHFTLGGKTYDRTIVYNG